MQTLNRNNIDHSTAPLPTKILQFGGGNFLRAFVDWMVQVLNEKTDFNAGVAIVKPTDYGDYQELKDQFGLFTVVLDGIKNGQQIQEIKRVDCVNSIINPYSEWERYLELAKDPQLRFVVSNTTEAGIKFNPEDSFNDSPPKEFPAKLTLFLYHRFQFFNGDPTKGLILLPCELIENNGLVLQKAVLKYAKHWELGSEFTSWISTANHFCSSLVDRIVSGYPKDRANAIEEELGYKDPMMVAGEYYHSWVIQAPASVQKELPFAQT
ncbi:MAG: tagaturonate reductase, partial [Arenibacter sp.]|nr:tagaturonate reductase [Arenibacter sp.]